HRHAVEGPSAVDRPSQGGHRPSRLWSARSADRVQEGSVRPLSGHGGAREGRGGGAALQGASRPGGADGDADVDRPGRYPGEPGRDALGRRRGATRGPLGSTAPTGPARARVVAADLDSGGRARRKKYKKCCYLK